MSFRCDRRVERDSAAKLSKALRVKIAGRDTEFDQPVVEKLVIRCCTPTVLNSPMAGKGQPLVNPPASRPTPVTLGRPTSRQVTFDLDDFFKRTAN
jgi:hypothetical protein